MSDDLRTRIAKVLFARNAGLGWDMKPRTWDGTDEDVLADWLADADAVIRELGPIPDREFTDQWGHHWEWCGGVAGTWEWRITRLEQR